LGGLFIASSGAARAGDFDFRVHSATFKNDGVLPDSMIDNFPATGPNSCTANGSAGGDLSPELTWEGAPWSTRSFAVMAFDVTASFTHWGIYNITANTTSLPGGAGAADSTYGAQVANDFTSIGYEGPCPPAGVEPFAHHYVFTVYALDIRLQLPVQANFPQNPETLFRALTQAGAEGHVLGKASIGGFFSSTPAQ
jgi:Raf kinase inhibitor-like YbhB/YbcL family protein